MIANPAAVEGLSRLHTTKNGRTDDILIAHHEVLKDDPQRLSTEFILTMARMPRGGGEP